MKILEEIIVKNVPMGMKIFPFGEENNHPSPRNPESPKQDKPKVKLYKTHINQTQTANIKSSKGKATSNTQGIPIMITVDLSTETL